jgi:hypothetical protein
MGNGGRGRARAIFTRAEPGALVLIPVDHGDDAVDHSLVAAHGQKVGLALVLLHVRLDDRVKHFVRRKRVLIDLVRSKLAEGGYEGASGMTGRPFAFR